MGEERGRSARSLLIVEDSQVAADALRVLFEESGFEVGVADSVAEAISAASKGEYGAMLLDLRLPDADGLVVMSELRARGVKLPLTYALTGTDDPAASAAALTAGCRAVIVKPARPMELLRRLKADLEGWQPAAG